MKNTVITGASSGIGFETAKELAARDHRIIMLNRSIERSEEAISKITSETGSKFLEYFIADFESIEQVKKAGSDIINKYDEIDILINNAGRVFSKRKITEDGNEATIQVNHLSHFALTGILLPSLLSAGHARIINVSSRAHTRVSGFNKNDMTFKKGYSSFPVYGISKLFNIYFTLELSSILKDTAVTVNALHPGVIDTNFANYLDPLYKFAMKLISPFLKKSKQGAETSIFLADSAKAGKYSGKYFSEMEIKDPSDLAQNRENRKWLWNWSEERTGVSYDIIHQAST